MARKLELRRGLVALVGLAGLVLIVSGCASTARVAWEKPSVTGSQQGPLYVTPVAAPDGGQKVGHHTFTVFALPVMDIRPSRPIGQSVAEAVHDGLAAAGYDVKPASAAPQGTPVVAPTLGKFHYWSYSWLWPVFLQGGGITLDLLVKGEGGAAIRQETLSARSFWPTLGGSYGFSSAIKGDMTSIVEQVRQKASSAAFRGAVGKAKR